MWHVYFRKGYYLLPVVAETDAGYFLDVGPVSKVPVGDEKALEAALESVILQQNPKTATPSRSSFPKPVVLEPAGVKSWASFEKKSICWTITYDGSSYVVAVTGRATKGGWTDAPEDTVRISRDEGVSAVVSAIAKHLRGRSDI